MSRADTVDVGMAGGDFAAVVAGDKGSWAAAVAVVHDWAKAAIRWE